jgi:uncharacterized protein YdgA (DUF945 family)
VKKGLVALLLALAVIVLVSPGIIGRLAEKSMDEQLEWAATEAEEVVVRSEGFDRGWFSSEGRHRIELRDGALRELLLAYSDAGQDGALPALVIDTRIDHGLIPLSSMAREQGTLVPGLGSAVSTVSLDTGDSDPVPLPGTIYSTLGLTGELHSNYVLEAGTFNHDGATAEWGAADVDVTTSPASGAIAFDGSIASFSVLSTADTVRIDNIAFAGEQRPSGFGFRVGPLRGSIDAIRFEGSAGPPVGPIAIDSTSSKEDGRVSARTSLRIENLPLEDLGLTTIGLQLRLLDADGRALGDIKRGFGQIPPGAGPDSALLAIEPDARRLIAAGLELHVDETRVQLPDGDVTAQFHLAIRETDADAFSWPGVLLAADATLDLRIAEPLVRLAMAANPDVGGIIGMGYLRRNGDVYELRAELEDGLLTVNGAPLPLPANAFQ